MPANPDAAPEAVERMVTAPCPRCGTIHLWDQDPRAADAAEVERLTSENARLREALDKATVVIRALLADLHEHDWPRDETWNAARAFLDRPPLAPLPDPGKPISPLEAASRSALGGAS